ncbi:TonB-dependent receptor [Aurantiacibacter poecillastricola]|uniref:TonB-dependent receptor n=1 Tax=Aurantiacibacter poecillastricola TaxID=3064385 RepID=UPI00273E3785|nr:TonB-dependent receptor [Aurantiacibacter sp. 219JJ12-13]MDP5260644.1 TonB-dependent receptor [Aurantiacibacter sp. 219JJ12-13]
MKLNTLSVASSLAIAVCMSTPAFAQDEAEAQEEAQQRDNQTNVIVVTAQFREQNLQETPIAITAVNAEMLAARGQTDISQVAAQAPNVTLRPQPQNGGSGLIAFIRGVGQTDFNFALDPAVGVYVDDVYIPTLSSSLLELVDLDRVEILRGPQGTLAGKNSLGGAIKLFSARPRGDGSGSLRVEYGSFNNISLRGMADIGLTDNLAVRVSGMGRSRDGYVDIVDYALTHPNSAVPANNSRGARDSYETLGGQNVVAGRIALQWEPNDRLTIYTAADFNREDSDAIATVLLAAGAVADNAEDFDPFSVNPATDADGNAWLPGTDGNPVPVDCRFVPAGQYSCDPVNLSSLGFDPRFASYSTFADTKVPTQQAPYKPYFALPITEFEGYGVMGNITYDLTENLQFVGIGSYRAYVSRWGQDQDATPVPVAQLDNELDHEAWSAEVRLNFEFADELVQGTVGGFYLDQDGEYTARVDLNYAGIDFVHGPDTTPSTTKAAFGTVTVTPSELFSITGGLRYTEDEKIYTYFRSNPDGTVPFREADNLFVPGVPACEFFLGAPTAGPTGIGNTPNCLLTGLFNISDGFKGDRWDWRIVGNLNVSEDVLLYGSVSTGFKGGGVNPRPFFGPSAGDCNAPGYVAPAPCNQLRAFDPETITTYEVGFKVDAFDRSLRLNGAAFYNDYQDIILTLSACPSIPCLQPRNVGEAEVKGFELELSAYPVDGLSFDGALSYIDFQYDEDTVIPAGLTGDEVTPYTPEWTFAIGAQYDHYTPAGSKISFRFDGSYQSEIYTETFNTSWSRIDGYFLGGARLAYTDPGDDWTVALRVDNLFDEYYFQSISDVTTSLGVVTGVPGLPRTWNLSIERRF